jgi:cell wall-associated NlpC family hydrolase
MKFGISELAIIPIRKEPSDISEMVSQILFGEHFKITNTNKNWSQIIVAHDNYVGWVCNKQITLIKEETYNKLVKEKPNITTNLFDIIIKNNIPQTIIAGSIIPNYKVNVFSIEKEAYQFDGPVTTGFNDKQKTVDIAKKFLNTPYLWGGKSPLGIDCSGLVQIVYRLQGINLPRDASQQEKCGVKITNLKKSNIGDLAFFNDDKGKVTHVGIIVSENKIIHASGKVRIDNINENGIFNTLANNYSHTLKTIKRIN